MPKKTWREDVRSLGEKTRVVDEPAVPFTARPANVRGPPPEDPRTLASAYKAVGLGDSALVPVFAEGKQRALEAGIGKVVAIEPDQLGVAIVGPDVTIVVPLHRIAWLRR